MSIFSQLKMVDVRIIDFNFISNKEFVLMNMRL